VKKRDLKQRLTDAFAQETPNLCDSILASCKQEEQLPADTPADAPASPRPSLLDKFLSWQLPLRRVAAAALCLVLFLSGFSVGLLLPEKEKHASPLAPETFIYLDVNPSIELQMDGENKVVKCLAGNEDATSVLADLKLEGVDMQTALSAVVGAMYMSGYLTGDANSILVSVDGKDESSTNAYLFDITEKINAVFEKSGMECSIIAQGLDVDDELRQKAEENGVSVGKMHLVDKMVQGIEGYDTEDASDLAHMSIKELNLLYSTRPGKGEKDDPFGKDISSGNVGGFVKQEEVLQSLLTLFGWDETDLEWCQIQAKPQRGEDKKMVYAVTVRFKATGIVYELKVDCESGEVVEFDTNLPDIFFPGGDKGNGETNPPSLDGGSQNDPSPNTPPQSNGHGNPADGGGNHTP